MSVEQWSALVIRPFREADWPRVLRIHDEARRRELAQCGLEDAFLPLRATYESESLFDEHVDVAELDGRVVGFIAYGDNEITWLYVESGATRRGIGRMLVRHAMAHMAGTVTVEVLCGNEPAKALYEACGFRVTEEHEGCLERNEDYPAIGYIMQRTK